MGASTQVRSSNLKALCGAEVVFTEAVKSTKSTRCDPAAVEVVERFLTDIRARLLQKLQEAGSLDRTDRIFEILGEFTFTDGSAVISALLVYSQNVSRKRLSKRLVEVGLLSSRGLSNKEIAQELGIGKNSVKNYVQSIYDQLGIHTRSELTLNFMLMYPREFFLQVSQG